MQTNTDREGSRATLRIAGELDIASDSAVRRALDAIERDDDVRTVVLDLRDLEFMDSTGMQLLMDLDVRAREAGREIEVVTGDGQVRQLLELSEFTAHAVATTVS